MDVAPVLSTFVDQAGLPLVTAEVRCEAGRAPALHLSQRRYLRLGLPRPDERRWKLPLCARYPGQGGPARACAVMEGAELDLPLPQAKGCPAWVVPNDGALGYYRVSLAPEMWAALLGGAAPLTRAERTALLGDLFALVASGDLPAADALAQVARAARSGDRYQVLLALAFIRTLHETVPDALHPKLARMAREAFGPPAKALGLKPRPKEDDELRLLREPLLEAAGLIGEDPELRKEARRLAAAWLSDRKAVEPEVLDSVLGLAAEGGDVPLYEQLHALALQTRDADERQTVFGAMGHFRAPELVKRNLELLMSGKIDLREAVGPFVFGALQRPEGRDVSYAFAKAHFDELLAKMPREETDALLFVGRSYCDAAHRQDVVSYFTPRSAQIPGGAKELAQTLETIDSCIALRERQQASAAAFLQRY
jgi:alanyl aminopeptidase